MELRDLLLLGLTCWSAIGLGIADDYPVLTPHVELEKERIEWNLGDQQGYRLYRFDREALRRWSWYEVRVSHLSTNAAQFRLGLVRTDRDYRWDMSKPRELLNTERFVIRTNGEVEIFVDGEQSVSVENVLLKVTAVSGGVRPVQYSLRESDKEENRFVLYNLIMEPLYLGGVLPAGAIRMVVWGLVCVGFSMFVAAPMLSRFLDKYYSPTKER